VEKDMNTYKNLVTLEYKKPASVAYNIST